MTIRRRLLTCALLLGLLGMHGLGSGHMTMLPTAQMTMSMPANHGPASQVVTGADEVMHHDLCVFVTRAADRLDPPAATPVSSGTPAGWPAAVGTPVARSGRAPPDVDLHGLCISRT